MKQRFIYDLGKDKNFIQMFLGDIVRELKIGIPLLTMAVFANYNKGDSLLKVTMIIYATCFVLFLPKIISSDTVGKPQAFYQYILLLF